MILTSILLRFKVLNYVWSYYLSDMDVYYPWSTRSCDAYTCKFSAQSVEVESDIAGVKTRASTYRKEEHGVYPRVHAGGAMTSVDFPRLRGRPDMPAFRRGVSRRTLIEQTVVFLF